MKITYLGSSSSGNSTYVENGEDSLLIDNGLPLKKIPFKATSGILLTHTHSDHIIGVEKYAKKYGIRCIADKSFILAERGLIDEAYLKYEDFSSNFYLDSFEVEPFGVWHDEVCFGFMLNKTYLHLTDTGVIPFTLLERIKRNPIKLLFMESNYDEDLIEESNYDSFLKDRIKGRTGHLSNQNVVNFLTLHKELLKDIKIVLGHFSKNTNDPELVTKRLQELPEEMLKNISFAENNSVEI